MKKVLLLILYLICLGAKGQIYDPVEWKTSSKKISASEYDLILTAVIDPGWHLYSQSVPEDGPIPTSFTFEKDGIELIGNSKEEEGTTVDDPVFGMKIKYFSDKAVFTQRVKASSGMTILCEVEFMVCDDTRCLPPQYVDVEFELD